MKDTRIVFMGTPEFAVAPLNALVDNFTVVAVVTQPDRPSGRGKKLTPPPVKVTAEALGIPVLQPTKIRDHSFVEWLQNLGPDFLVTAAYGRILPANVLAIPKISALNIHASLLPRWRGAAPIHRAVMAGDGESGITVMHMDEGMDTGDMILREAVTIGPDETTGNLHDKLMPVGAQLIVEAITDILQGKASRIPQDHRAATPAHPLSRDEELIDWCASTEDVHNHIRGLNPWPGAYTYLHGERIKVWSGKPAVGSASPCGCVIDCGADGMVVATGDGAYRLTRIQPAGKKEMNACDFLCGNPLGRDTILGN